MSLDAKVYIGYGINIGYDRFTEYEERVDYMYDFERADGTELVIDGMSGNYAFIMSVIDVVEDLYGGSDEVLALEVPNKAEVIEKLKAAYKEITGEDAGDEDVKLYRVVWCG
jgi:hypothetical protein